MKHNDRGVTIIEVLVTVIILGVLVSVISLSFHVLERPKTSTVATRIGSLLEKTRLVTMSKADASYLVLYEDDNGLYMTTTTTPSSFVKAPTKDEQICQKDVTIIGVLEDGSEVKVKEEQILFLTFDPSTGGFKEEGTTGKYMKQLIVAYRETTKRSTIQLVKATGKYYIE